MSLEDFDVGQDKDAEKIAHEFTLFYNNTLPHLFPTQAQQLKTKINELELIPEDGEDPGEYGSDFNLMQEINQLLKMVRAMRGKVLDEDGRVKEDVTAREMKEVVSSTTQLTTLLMKSHEQLMGYDRMRVLEKATLEALKELGGGEIAEQFVKRVAELLEDQGVG